MTIKSTTYIYKLLLDDVSQKISFKNFVDGEIENSREAGDAEELETNLACGARAEREMNEAREALLEFEQVMECVQKKKPFWKRW